MSRRPSEQVTQLLNVDRDLIKFTVYVLRIFDLICDRGIWTEGAINACLIANADHLKEAWRNEVTVKAEAGFIMSILRQAK